MPPACAMRRTSAWPASPSCASIAWPWRRARRRRCRSGSARAATLDRQARDAETANLPRGVVPDRRCGRRRRGPRAQPHLPRTLAQRVLQDAALQRTLRERAAVPDRYAVSLRALGAYPLLRWPFFAGVQAWQNEHMQAVARWDAQPPPRLRFDPPADDPEAPVFEIELRGGQALPPYDRFGVPHVARHASRRAEPGHHAARGLSAAARTRSSPAAGCGNRSTRCGLPSGRRSASRVRPAGRHARRRHRAPDLRPRRHAADARQHPRLRLLAPVLPGARRRLARGRAGPSGVGLRAGRVAGRPNVASAWPCAWLRRTHHVTGIAAPSALRGERYDAARRERAARRCRCPTRAAADRAASTPPTAWCAAPSAPSVSCSGRWASPAPARCANGATMPRPSSAGGISMTLTCWTAASCCPCHATP